MDNSITARRFCNVLREQVWQKRPEWWQNQDWFIHQDNALAHTAFSVQKILATKYMAVVPRPPYSSDLTPSDFFLFLRLKSHLKVCHLQDVSEIQEQWLTVLHTISKRQFQRWQKC
jgi:hypothetical protein